MLKKRQIFFLIIFTIIFTVGFFVDARFFTASLHNSDIKNIIPLPSPAPVIASGSSQSQIQTAKTLQESRQDMIDGIKEELDMINARAQVLIAEQNKDNQPAVADKEQKPDDQIAEDKNNQEQNNNQKNNQEANDLPAQTSATNKNSGGGGGAPPAIYSKILISEIQIAPIEQRFVELYNPNLTDIDLTGWYLQRKDANDTSWNSFVSSTNFNGKTIPANSYFLISRQLANSDILSDITITENNSFALKNPGRDIADELDLLATVSPSTGQSIGRRVMSDLTQQDTGNNSADFELDTPTPRAQNIAYVAPIAPPEAPPTPPADVKNILINEIQTAGQTTKDEFVELFNSNNFDVDLLGFSLKKKTSRGTESNLVSSESFAGTISACGYFLIAPQPNDDGTPNYTGSAIPNLYYSGKSYSIADDNTVLLYDKNNNLQDKVGFGNASDFETAPTQNPPAGKIITRTNGIDTNDNSIDFSLIDTASPSNSSI